MNKYQVQFDERKLLCYEVMAENEEQADVLATQLLKEGKQPNEVIASPPEFYDILEINNQ